MSGAAGQDIAQQIIDDIQRLAEELNGMTGRLTGLAFADERGWLKPEEEEELRRGDAAQSAGARQLDELIRQFRRTDGGLWRGMLDSRLAALARVQRERQRQPEPLAGLTPDFLAALLPDLMAALAALRDGEDGRHAPSWALAVSRELCAAAAELDRRQDSHL